MEHNVTSGLGTMEMGHPIQYRVPELVTDWNGHWSTFEGSCGTQALHFSFFGFFQNTLHFLGEIVGAPPPPWRRQGLEGTDNVTIQTDHTVPWCHSPVIVAMHMHYFILHSNKISNKYDQVLGKGTLPEVGLHTLTLESFWIPCDVGCKLKLAAGRSEHWRD